MIGAAAVDERVADADLAVDEVAVRDSSDRVSLLSSGINVLGT